MSNHPSDQQLITRVQAGDKRAFDLLVLKYQYKVHSLIKRFIHDPDEAMDLAQESFIKAYRALPDFRGDSQFYTWLYRIAANTAKNHLSSRRRQAFAHSASVDNEEDPGIVDYITNIETPENIHARDELAVLVFKALDSLPANLKKTLELREFEHLSYEDIAEILGCPVGTVRSRIHRAREIIDDVVNQYMHP